MRLELGGGLGWAGLELGGGPGWAGVGWAWLTGRVEKKRWRANFSLTVGGGGHKVNRGASYCIANPVCTFDHVPPHKTHICMPRYKCTIQ